MTKSSVSNHSYCTRFRLHCAGAANLSFEKVFESDHAAQSQMFVLCERRRIKACLPRDIIFNVLVFLPAEVLFKVMRYVCWEWYHMIKEPAFVTAHLQASPIRVLIQHGIIGLTYCVDANSAGLAITESGIPMSAKVCGSLNGLILLQDRMHPENFHVVNLVTGMKKTLPRFGDLMTVFNGSSPSIAHLATGSGFSSTLACTSGGHYKVFCVMENSYSRLHVLVYTMGVDNAWRVVEHIPRKLAVELFMDSDHSVVGFVYWCRSDRCGFAFDVDAE